MVVVVVSMTGGFESPLACVEVGGSVLLHVVF
jgi:hypothetical protein